MSITNEQHLAARNLRASLKDGGTNIGPYLAELLDRAGATSDMSSEEIERRLGPFTDELVAWAYTSLAELAREYDVEPVVALLPMIGDTDGAYHDEWTKLSKVWDRAGYAFIYLGDAYGPLNERNVYKLAPWDWHPNGQGHSLIARNLLKELADVAPVSVIYPDADVASDDAVNN